MSEEENLMFDELQGIIQEVNSVIWHMAKKENQLAMNALLRSHEKTFGVIKRIAIVPN